MAQAVWRYNIYRKIQWLIQFAVIITPVIIHTNQLVMCVFLEIIVLLFDILLWYNGSSMSQEKMAINCSHCCKHLVRAKTQQCACQLNHDEGLASLITDEMSYVHVDTCAVAVVIGRVLRVCNLEGVKEQAVWRYNIYRKIHCLVQTAVV
ncbi:hypothetical protein, partial [Acinetobacter baumannii]|uniref:hypothetical protein n=1 Tax=Acinetobacter baumannii TaxID=470 RepID=UPI001D18C625